MKAAKSKATPSRALIAVVVVALGLIAPPADAIFYSLDQLFAGESFVIGDKLFDDWMTPYDDHGVDLSGIHLTPLPEDDLNPGILYTALDDILSVPEGCSYLDLTFRFSVATTDGSVRIKDNSLDLLDFEFGEDDAGRIQIIERVADNPEAFGSGKDEGLIGQKNVEADQVFNIFDLSDHIDFTPVSKKFFVETKIMIFGDGGTGVQLNSFEQHFSQTPVSAVPEAASTLGLLALVLLATEGMRRKLR